MFFYIINIASSCVSLCVLCICDCHRHYGWFWLQYGCWLDALYVIREPRCLIDYCSFSRLLTKHTHITWNQGLCACILGTRQRALSSHQYGALCGRARVTSVKKYVLRSSSHVWKGKLEHNQSLGSCTCDPDLEGGIALPHELVGRESAIKIWQDFQNLTALLRSLSSSPSSS